MPIDPRVREEMVRHLQAEFANASSRTHAFGQRARRAVEHARDQVAAVVGAARGEVIFTSGATESNNLAILGLLEHGRRTDKRHIVSTQIEHSAVLGPLDEARRQGFEVTYVPPTRGGWVEPAAIRQAMRDDTLLVSVMHVNNETGVIQPVEQIAQLLGDHPAFFHVDAAQSYGRLITPLRTARIDLISVSGHKIHAPQGIGALILRRRGVQRPPLQPLLHGGGQELGLRSGTLPVHLIVGLGAASELALAEEDERRERCLVLRTRLLEAIAPLSPLFNGDPEKTVPHILNVAFPCLDSETAIEALRDVVAITSGAACSSQTYTCRHVLSAMGLSDAQVEGSLRFSWCHMTPEPDWDRLRSVVQQQQALVTVRLSKPLS